MIDLLTGIDLKTKYEKQAAGPLDPSLIYNKKSGVEALGAQYEIMQVKEEETKLKKTSNDEAMDKLAIYSPGPNVDLYQEKALELFGDASDQVNKVIRFMKGQDTDGSEIIATIFAIWNDLKAKKQEVTTNKLVELFLKWHPKKNQKFKNEQQLIKRLITQMRENGIEPPGKKPIMT